jgi:hypothetical protein
MDVHDINKEILNAKDLTLDDIALIQHTLRVKQVRISNAQLGTLEIGDTVRFTNIRPKYMIGEIGKISGWRGTKIEVQLQHSIGKFRNGTILVPATCVVKVDE